jgi:serine protease
MPLKVLSARGFGSVGAIADAIRFAVDHGAQVINMSLGGRLPSRVLANAVRYAHAHGVTVVCAAGNDGRGRVSYPAAYPGAIAVAATQFDEQTTFYSNWGREIDVAAPGGNTRVDQNRDGLPDGVLQNTIVAGDPQRSDYLLFMGTSMASPHVAGVAALLVSQGVTRPQAIERVLEKTARVPPSGKRGERYGAGIVDAGAALSRVVLRYGFYQLLCAAALALLVLRSLARRRLLGLRPGLGFTLALVVGSSGLFFLPHLVGWLGGGPLPLGGFYARGFPAWDLALLGPSGHANPVFYSALAPIVLVGLLYGVHRLRGLLCGLTLGIAGHLFFHAFFRLADIRYLPDWPLFEPGYLLANVLVCLAVARIVARK